MGRGVHFKDDRYNASSLRREAVQYSLIKVLDLFKNPYNYDIIFNKTTDASSFLVRLDHT